MTATGAAGASLLRYRQHHQQHDEHGDGNQDGQQDASSIPRNVWVFPWRAADVVNCVRARSGNAGTGIHATAVHSNVQPARPDTEASAMQPEVEVNSGNDLYSTAKTKGHFTPDCAPAIHDVPLPRGERQCESQF